MAAANWGPKSSPKNGWPCCERAFRFTPTRRSRPTALQKNPLANLDDAHWRARGLARRVGVWSEARPQNVGTLLGEDQGGGPRR
jgi:hypothetical protein